MAPTQSQGSPWEAAAFPLSPKAPRVGYVLVLARAMGATCEGPPALLQFQFQTQRPQTVPDQESEAKAVCQL